MRGVGVLGWMVGRGDGTTYVTLVGRYAALDRVCVVGRRRGRGALWGVCGDVVSQRFTRSVHFRSRSRRYAICISDLGDHGASKCVSANPLV